VDSLTVSEAAQDAAAETQSFDPPAYLMPYYERLAARYQIAWPVLASLSYVQSGGYGRVVAGVDAAPLAAAARATAAGGSRALNVNVIAHAASAAAQPSPDLFTAARKLAAAGGAQTPALAIQTLTGSYSSTDAVLTIAQEIGELPTDTTASPSVRINAMLREAELLNGLPYVWGGGHENPAWLVDGGYDCSGFVSAVLHAAGYLDSQQTTQTLPSSQGILKGPGQYVTIYDRTINTTKFPKRKKRTAAAGSSELSITQATNGVHLSKGRHTVSIQLTPAAEKAIEQAAIQKGNEQDTTINDEHVIIDIDGQWWESGGDSQDGGGASVHQIASISQSYLKSFNLVLHPAGL
jgi:cell wall-associated NlpC family hydrolase